MLRTTLKVLLLGLSLPALSAQAMDLLGAYRAALVNDATFQSVQAASGATRETLPQARAQLLPQLSASATKFRNRTDKRITSETGSPSVRNEHFPDYDSSNASLSLRQPLFRLASVAGYLQAQALVEGADAAEEKGRQDLVLRVASAYFEVLFARDSQAQLLAQQESLAAQLKAAQRAFAAGQGTRTEIEEAQARFDATAAQLIAARSQVDYALEQLQALVGEPVASIDALVPERLKLVPPDPLSLDEWVRLGEARSPELKRLQAEVDAADKELLKAQAGHFPTVDLVAQRTRSENDMVTALSPDQTTTYLNSQLGVQVSIPIFSSGYVGATAAEARQRLAKARADLEAARRALRVQLRQQFQGVADGIEQIRAQEQALRSAEQALTGTRKGVQAGTRTSLDVLNAEDKRAGALRDLGQVRYRYLLSRIALQALAGGDSVGEVERINAWLAR